MNDEELVKYVLAFAGEINALQRKYAAHLEAEREHSRTEAFLEAYRAEAGLIYARYLTERERTYYTTLSVPPTDSSSDSERTAPVTNWWVTRTFRALSSRGMAPTAAARASV